MAGYIGTQAVSVNTTSATISDDLAVGDDATIAGTLGVTGVLTATSLDISGAIDVDGVSNLDVVDIDGAVNMATTLDASGVITVKHTDGVANVSLSPTSTGGVVNVRNSSGVGVITLDGRNSLVTVGNGLTLTDGNLTVASGHGISFAATADGGATTPSELLDDYEEGTYTATVTPSSSGSIGLSSGFGSYTKIGNLVTVNASCSTNAISSPVGYFKLNLPFTCNNTNQNGRAAASFYLDGMASGNNVSDFIGLTVENTTECRVYLGDSNGAVSDSAQQVDASAYILISVTYRTA